MEIVTKATGDSLTATEFNQIPNEIENVISDAGLTPSAGDSAQLAKAMAFLVGDADYYSETGAANAYVLAPVSPREGITAYVDGHRVSFIPTNSNTGASTINVNGIGLKNIKKGAGAGSDPASGDLTAGILVELRYDSANSCYKIFQALANSIPGFGTRTDLASATTTDLGSISTQNVRVTGTTTITSFGSSATATAPIYMVRFSAALTLTHNATSLIIPGGANITTAANDAAICEYLGSGNWRVLEFTKASGRTILSASESQPGDVELASSAETQAGSSTSLAVHPSGLKATLGWVLIEAQDISSPQATVDFTTGIDSTYEHYVLTCDNGVVATDAVAIWVRLRQTATYQTTNYAHRSIGNIGGTATPVGDTATNDAKFIVSPAGFTVGNAGNEQFNFEIFFSNPASTTFPKQIRGLFSGVAADGNLIGGEVSGSFYGTPSTAANGIRVMTSSGNISGKFKLYGIRKA